MRLRRSSNPGARRPCRPCPAAATSRRFPPAHVAALAASPSAASTTRRAPVLPNGADAATKVGTLVKEPYKVKAAAHEGPADTGHAQSVYPSDGTGQCGIGSPRFPWGFPCHQRAPDPTIGGNINPTAPRRQRHGGNISWDHDWSTTCSMNRRTPESSGSNSTVRSG